MSSKQHRFLVSHAGLSLLKEAKAQMDISFVEIAERANLSYSTVKRVFHPEHDKPVKVESAIAVAKVLDILREDILSENVWMRKSDGLYEAERRIQEAIENNLITLDLSELSLVDLPESISALTDLISLNLNGNRIQALSDAIGQLTKLEVVSINRNQLIDLPESFGNLVELEELTLFNNQITSLPDSLARLKSLKKIDLWANDISLFPEILSQIRSLEIIDIGSNDISAIPDCIQGLKSLKRLNIGQNSIEKLPASICELNKLESLVVSANYLSELPNNLYKLSSLRVLGIAANLFDELPESIFECESLEVLLAGNNPVEHLSGRIGNLKKLVVLDLSKKEESILDAEPYNYEVMQATWTSSGLGFPNVSLLRIPDSMQSMKSLRYLFLHGNKHLRIPTEIMGKWNVRSLNPNAQSVLEYYFKALKSRSPLNEAKLIFVGFGAVGKTSLVSCLRNRKFDPTSRKTEGIQITPWSIQIRNTENQAIEDITLNIWDFGGQEIMHSTHQFFLTERSLYVLVLNGRQGHEDSDAEYWLELIQSFGDDSPVIVVLNKVAEHPFDVNRRALTEKYNNIKAFVKTDCKTGQGIKQLKENIKKQTDHLEDLRAPFPGSWVAIKDELANMTDNYISFEKYREICKRDGEEELESQDSLAVHLHNLGIALNYKDDPRLRDTHVLNPRWVTSGIYTLLNDADLTEKKGELTANCLIRILDPSQYPRERHGFLLDLMRKFELCLRFAEDENRYLIPDLLDKQQPEAASDFILADGLNFRYTYPILPEGLIPRFIVRTHVLSEQSERWRTGVILSFEGNRALIKADPQDRHVTISINGPAASRRRLLAIIRSDFDRIHSSFKFIPEELVPIPQHPTVTVRYRDLLLREQKGRTTFEEVVDGELVELSVQGLLNGVDIEGSRQQRSVLERRSDSLRLFYSYSHKDEHLRDQLETHLKILERQGLIQGWHDRRITGGEDWKTELDKKLQQADIILLLISADFISSDYCYETEMTMAMERHQQGQATVIPIALRPTDWGNAPFKGLQGLPSDLNPVTQWSDRDAAWYNVEQGIKQSIEDRRRGGT